MNYCSDNEKWADGLTEEDENSINFDVQVLRPDRDVTLVATWVLNSTEKQRALETKIHGTLTWRVTGGCICTGTEHQADNSVKIKDVIEFHGRIHVGENIY